MLVETVDAWTLGSRDFCCVEFRGMDVNGDLSSLKFDKVDFGCVVFQHFEP